MNANRTLVRRLAVVALSAWTLGGAASAASAAVPATPKPAQADSAGIAFFEKKIRPALIDNCYQCHSSASQKIKGNLRLDSRESILKGGDSGPAMVPGDLSRSALIKAIQWADEDTRMPPKTQLPPQVVEDFKQWVQMGAPWPVEKKGGTAVVSESQEAKWAKLKKEHWAWQPVKPAPVPAVKETAWPKSDVDRFVLATLESKGLHVVGDADRVTLIRRATYDLTGLPPRPDDVIAFVSDKSPDAYENVVDRLLASPQFGERWGRHWLDIARYAESTGLTRNFPYHYAWKYRDYVIDSFNEDKPYNTFVMEQIAGDLMPAKTPAERNERLVATGFLALGIKDLNERDREKYVMDNVDEQIDTFSRSILATTIACARCHDHKFDPISTAEYYQVAGIFRSTEIQAGIKNKRGGVGRDYADKTALLKLSPAKGADQPTATGKPAADAEKTKTPRPREIAALERDLLKAQLEMRELLADAGFDGDKESIKKLLRQNPAKARPILTKRQQIQELRQRIEKAGGAPADVTANTPTAEDDLLAMGVEDASRPADCRINIHGDHDNLGNAVPRGFVSLIQGPSVPAIKPDESGRLQLAMWTASAQNPLTSRVMVNRIWHHLFGEGLVRTVDNFGTTGEAPSHPQLLDYLASQFVRDGWSTKKMIRSLVLTRTYQLGATYDEANYQIDPANVSLWRHAPQRLSAEEIRDAMLFVGQNLNLDRPKGSAVASLPDQELREGRRGALFDRTGGTYRSVYVPTVRSLVNPMLDTFDLAEPTMVTGDRDVTTVATQALFMMNNNFTVEQSKRLAEKLLKDSSIGNENARVDHAYGWTVGRSATAAERSRALQYVDQFVKEAGGNSSQARNDAWTSLVQALMASAEFRYVN